MVRIKKHRFNCWLLKPFKINAITLYPFVLYKYGAAKSYLEYTIQHELVHIEQVQKVGWFKFYFSYLFQYFKSRFKGYSHNTAYRTISFEASAFRMQYFPRLDKEAKRIKDRGF